MAVFLKSPRVSTELTRGPNQCKSNYIQALFYALRPLNFLDFEPAVQLGCFSALALGSFQFLGLSP